MKKKGMHIVKSISIELGHKDPQHIKKMHDDIPCLSCGATRNLDFHHLVYSRYSTQKNSDHMGVMLCKKCHNELHYGIGAMRFWSRFAGYKSEYKNIKDDVIAYAIHQAISIFALQCVNMDKKDIIESYKRFKDTNGNLLENRMFKRNLWLDIQELERIIYD